MTSPDDLNLIRSPTLKLSPICLQTLGIILGAGGSTISIIVPCSIPRSKSLLMNGSYSPSVCSIVIEFPLVER